MPRFVIQENHTRTHHFDFRLEKGGVVKDCADPDRVQKNPRKIARFQLDRGGWIRGAIYPKVIEKTAIAMNRDFTKKRAIAKMNMKTVSTRAGKKKLTCELTVTLRIEGSPTVAEMKS